MARKPSCTIQSPYTNQEYNMNAEWNGADIALLKEVYYKLTSEGEFCAAQVIARTLFEFTTASGEPWGLYWPGDDSQVDKQAAFDGVVNKLMEIDGLLAGHPEMKSELAVIVVQEASEDAAKLIDEGRSKEALAGLNRCITQFEGIYYCVGWAFYNMGRLEESAEHLRKALEINPANTGNLNLMGQVMSDLGKPAEAEAYLRKAIKIDPEYALGFYDLGVILAKLRTRDTAARRCFCKAIRLDPSLGWAYYSIGCLDALAGKRAKALANLKTALEKGVSDIAYFEQDSDLDSVRNDEAYERLMAEYLFAK
jgi:tetratricopeptide (TPR) repeat protein